MQLRENFSTYQDNLAPWDMDNPEILNTPDTNWIVMETWENILTEILYQPQLRVGVTYFLVCENEFNV